MNSAMQGGSKRNTTPLINMVGHALLRSPFTGYAAREHVPMLYRHVSRSVRNNAFDDNISHDKESSSLFKYLDAENGGEDLNVTNEGDEPKNPPKPTVEPTQQPEKTTEEEENGKEESQVANNRKKHNSIDVSTFF